MKHTKNLVFGFIDLGSLRLGEIIFLQGCLPVCEVSFLCSCLSVSLSSDEVILWKSYIMMRSSFGEICRHWFSGMGFLERKCVIVATDV